MHTCIHACILPYAIRFRCSPASCLVALQSQFQCQPSNCHGKRWQSDSPPLSCQLLEPDISRFTICKCTINALRKHSLTHWWEGIRQIMYVTVLLMTFDLTSLSNQCIMSSLTLWTIGDTPWCDMAVSLQWTCTIYKYKCLIFAN